MVTADQIIFPALERINVKDPDVTTIRTSEANTAIIELNDMMISLADHDGIQLGYTIIASLTDEITTPDWSHGMMRARLTLLLAGEFGKNIAPGMVAKDDNYMSGVRRRCIRVPSPSLPDGLPCGQGNNANGYGRNTGSNFFYNEGSDDLRDELGSALADENGNPLDNNQADT